MLAEQVGPMLARAHLLRMRGQWAEAADQCVESLRIDPRNPTAHSLLGDIYQDQGRVDDARHWYHLALELNPGSTADRAKLERAEEALEAKQQRAEWTAVIEGRRQPISTSFLVREAVQRVLAIAGAAVCGMILVMATLASVADHNRAETDQNPPPGLVRPKKGTAVIPRETRYERDLLRRLSQTPNRDGGQVVGLTFDPRAGIARLRVFIPDSMRKGVLTGEYRTRILREAYRYAYLAHQLDHAITTVEIFAVGPDSTDAGENGLLMVGSTTPKELWQSPESVPPDRLTTAFTDAGPLWWSRDLQGP